MKETINESNSMQARELKTMRIRLDAIVLLLLKTHCGDKKGRIKISEAAPLLHSAGYSPTEIAKILGKKKPSEVAPYLYSKTKSSKKKVSKINK